MHVEGYHLIRHSGRIAPVWLGEPFHLHRADTPIYVSPVFLFHISKNENKGSMRVKGL